MCAPRNQTKLLTRENFFSLPSGEPLYQKQFGVFSQIFSILQKKAEINFKIGGIGYAFVFTLHTLNVGNFINEKGNYD
jgi:hypothetical protein